MIPYHGGTTNVKKRRRWPEWIVRNKFEDELANFMLEKKSHTKGIGEMLDQHSKEMHEQFSQIFSKIGESETHKPKAPTFAITTRSGVSTRDPLSQPLKNRHLPIVKEQPKRKDLRVQSQALHIMKNLPLSHPFSTNPLNSYKSAITRSYDPHAKGAKVLRDLLSHKEKLKKAASSVKLSGECSTIIQRSMLKKEGDPGSFALPCLIGPLAVRTL
ncbi:hypothetical protein Tco_0340402 [Tanacetum coccineum]